MPAIYFHYITYDLVYDRHNPYRRAAMLGAQGADPFFYFGRGLCRRKNGIENRKMGDNLHHINIPESIEAMIEYANRKENEVERNILLNYIKGYLFHYCIDKNCHPYIFYRSGFATNQDENQKHYLILHCRFESELDLAILNRYHHQRFHPIECLLVKRRTLKLISEMYYFVAQKVFYPCSFFSRKTFYKSVKDMRTVYYITYSRLGFKKRFFERRFPNRHINAISLPMKEDKSLDLMNLSHSLWRDPVTGYTSDLSIIDMVENAKRDYEHCKNYTEILDKSVLHNYLLKFTHDTDFDGSKIGSKKFYYSLYRKDF